MKVTALGTGFYYRDGERPDDLAREAAMYLEQGSRTVTCAARCAGTGAELRDETLEKYGVKPG
ncbi:MAG TPA: hypothetical protein VJ794_01145 [Gemmatimonadales bacterium]|nr:hypothetical protein [Gemmatimonadales bacterium]